MKKVNSKPPTSAQVAELEALAALPDDRIDTSDAPEQRDWNGARRGALFHAASESVREGLRVVEEREAKLLALRATLDASIARGGEVTDEELDTALAAESAESRINGLGG